MTAQKLYETLKFLHGLDKKLGLQVALNSIREALKNLVSSPAQPQYQSALASAIDKFTSAAAELGESLTPSQAELIRGMGGADFFDPSIADKVKDSIAKNAMTPSVARDFVEELASRREHFLEMIETTFRGLAELKITDTKVEPGSADVVFLIPRNLFDNELGKFAKQLTFINSLIRDFSEAITNQVESVELQELSSSLPTVALVASAIVLEALARILNKFLDAWKKIEEIREIRERLTKIGFKGIALEQLTQEILATVQKTVDESTTILLAEYRGDTGRKNELSNALSRDLRRLFGQIERGLTVEFRAEANKDEQDEAKRKALEGISSSGRQMRFPQIANEPLLLTNGQILEGPIESIKASPKKAAPRRSSKKGVQMKTKAEATENA